MAVLVIADHTNATLSDAVAKTITAAQALGGDIDILVAGEDAGGAAGEASKLSGVRKILHADDPVYGRLLAEPTAALIVSIAGDYDAIVAPATANGKNIMPRVAAGLDVMQISDVISVDGPDTFKRPIYAGNAISTVQSTDPKKVVTVRTASFKAVDASGAAPVEAIDSGDKPGVSKFVSEEITKSDRPELTAAKIIISGGRRSARTRISRNLFTRSPTSSALRLARRARRSTPATCRTIIRSARQAKSSRRNCT